MRQTIRKLIKKLSLVIVGIIHVLSSWMDVRMLIHSQETYTGMVVVPCVYEYALSTHLNE